MAAFSLDYMSQVTSAKAKHLFKLISVVTAFHIGGYIPENLQEGAEQGR